MELDPSDRSLAALSDDQTEVRRPHKSPSPKAQRGMVQAVREPASSQGDGMSVRASLGLAFACVVTGALVIGVFSLFQMGRLNASTGVIYNQEYTAGQAAEQVRSNVLRAARAQTQLLTSSTVAERDALANDIETSLANVDKKIALIQGLSTSEESVTTAKQWS
jgi:methyl-accepting chemotaxis protein